MIDNRESILKSFINSFIKEDFFIDVVNVGLYPSEFTVASFSPENKFSTRVKKFFNDLIKICSNSGIQNIKQIKHYIELSSAILNIKDEKSSIINYDNVFQHFISPNIAQQKLLQFVVNNKLQSIDDFRKKIDVINTNIQIFYEVQSISGSIISFDNFLEIAKNPSTVIETVKMFKENVISLYNELSKLQCINKLETEKDYFIIGDLNSIKVLSESVVQHISSGYSFLKTGYDIIDNSVDGIESCAVHVFAAPSNHGKSIFKVNLAYRMIKENIDYFNKDDAVLFVTLEDDKYKLNRRLCSIFGNIDASVIKLLYTKTYTMLKNKFCDKQVISTKAIEIINKLIIDSVYKVTNGNIKIIIKQAEQNSFSAGDLSKFIDLLKTENINIKLIYEDYIDVKSPTLVNYSQFNDYDVHGIIVQEQQNLARRYKIPLITSTQLKRGSEALNFPLDVTMIGDSDKKRRFTDFLYLFRQDKLHGIFDSEVITSVVRASNIDENNNINPKIRSYYDRIVSDLIPIELKIGKSKDSKRDQHGYMLFCNKNLRIYNNVEEYISDINELDKNTQQLEESIKNITDYIVNNIDLNIFDSI